MSYSELMAEVLADESLKERFRSEPKRFLAQRGIEVPEGVEIRVLEDTATLRHVVIPHLPAGGGDVTELAQRASKFII